MFFSALPLILVRLWKTGCELSQARQLLESAGWDLSQAVNLYTDLYATGEPGAINETPIIPTSDDFSNSRSRTASAVASQFDEDGIRAPDEVINTQLVTPAYRPYQGAPLQHQQSEDATVEWLFAPPADLIFPGPIEQVCKMRKRLLSAYFAC